MNNGDGMLVPRRIERIRINDVMITGAVYFEVALVIAAGYDALILHPAALSNGPAAGGILNPDLIKIPAGSDRRPKGTDIAAQG